MSDEIKTEHGQSDSGTETVTNRRRLLKLGAASVPAIVTLRGGNALAQTQVSLGMSNCTVTVPPAIVQDFEGGNGVNGRTFTAEEIATILDGNPLTTVTSFDSDYADYLSNMTNAGSGMSCVASIQTAVMTPP